MNKIKRRTFLYQGAVATGAFAFEAFVSRGALAAGGRRDLVATRANGGYGPLSPVVARNAPEAFLALPKGFEYKILGRTGTPMSDGNPTPARHDGMAAFAVDGQIRLVRNHEIANRVGTAGIALGRDKNAYDALAGGGTTTMVVDAKSRELIKDFVSLSGTLVNCAGGPTPWGSWITCEETILGPYKGASAQGQPYGGFEKKHGYCFEVPARADGVVAAVPLKQMGRFVHEAIAVDPRNGIVYETEDQGASGFYRLIPERKGRLSAGGRLQMLAVDGKPGYDTRTGQKAGTTLDAVWVDIEDPDPPEADTSPQAVYNQGAKRGGAVFARLEGCWYADGRIVFISTSGGNAWLGQVWEFRPTGSSRGHLRLLFESPSADLLEAPDNVCISPRGGLVLCEDGRAEQYIRGLTRAGRIFDFARNIVPVYSGGEFAGATFSPDGETLFVNIQNPGITFAIWGPWKDGAL